MTREPNDLAVAREVDFEGLGALMRAAGVPQARCEAIVDGHLRSLRQAQQVDLHQHELLTRQSEAFLAQLRQTHCEALAELRSEAAQSMESGQAGRFVHFRSSIGRGAMLRLLILSIAIQLAILSLTVWPFISPYVAHLVAYGPNSTVHLLDGRRHERAARMGNA